MAAMVLTTVSSLAPSGLHMSSFGSARYGRASLVFQRDWGIKHQRLPWLLDRINISCCSLCLLFSVEMETRFIFLFGTCYELWTLGHTESVRLQSLHFGICAPMYSIAMTIGDQKSPQVILDRDRVKLLLHRFILWFRGEVYRQRKQTPLRGNEYRSTF